MFVWTKAEARGRCAKVAPGKTPKGGLKGDFTGTPIKVNQTKSNQIKPVRGWGLSEPHFDPFHAQVAMAEGFERERNGGMAEIKIRITIRIRKDGLGAVRASSKGWSSPGPSHPQAFAGEGDSEGSQLILTRGWPRIEEAPIKVNQTKSNQIKPNQTEGARMRVWKRSGRWMEGEYHLGHRLLTGGRGNCSPPDAT
jgi:hypothetical protein